MPYKSVTVWIFTLLALLVALMFLIPTPFVIGLGVVLLPVLVVIQTIVILRAKDESKHTFKDKWYDKH